MQLPLPLQLSSETYVLPQVPRKLYLECKWEHRQVFLLSDC